MGDTNEFLNKRILITGASSGIGQACAFYYLNNGAKVALCGRDVDTLKKIGCKYPGQGAVINLDLSDDLQIFDLKTTVIEILGGVDILINCAGVLFDGDVEKTFPQDYDYVLDVNLRSVFILLKSLKSYFSNNTTIVNVSCLHGTKPSCGVTSYAVTKSGLEMMTKFAAAEFAESGVRVNAVTSSPVDTNSQRYVGVGDKEYNNYKSRVGKYIPLGRMAYPDDIAKAIIYLTSKRSSQITGQIVKVDGGRYLTTSGWVPYRGMKNMNARFEPDGVKPMVQMKEFYGKLTKKKETEYPTNEEEIEKTLMESNWSTRLSEAHEKVTANYKNIKNIDEFLKEKYVKN